VGDDFFTYTISDKFGATSTATVSVKVSDAPFIEGMVADDPDGSDSIYSNGDTITVKFSEPTNQPFKAETNNQLTKANVNALFTFSQNLGVDYTATWLKRSTLLITIVDVTGSTPPTIGGLTITVKESAELKNALGTSLASTFTSPPLDGSFGVFEVAAPIVDRVASTLLPAGTTTQVRVPPATSGTVEISRSDLDTVGANNVEITFAGTIVDIIPPLASCSILCEFIFILEEDDLDNAGLTAQTLRIFHDINDDGDVADDGETLVPTIILLSPTGPFIVKASDSFTSKFAVGGIRPLFLGGLSGEFAPPTLSGKAYEENEFPLTINDEGFKLEQYSNTIPTKMLETGEAVQLKITAKDSGGAQSIQHIALYMNLRGIERDIQYSDTFIIFDKGSPLEVNDPHDYFDTVNVTPISSGTKLELIFDVKFAKPMEKSDLIIRMWDDRRNSADVKILDAIQVVGSETESVQESADQIEQIQTAKQSIPPWIKNNAGWWSDGQIDDSDFVQGIQYLIQQKIMSVPDTESDDTAVTQQIPSWIKSNAGWWRDGLISDDDFVHGIQWLISNGIVKV